MSCEAHPRIDYSIQNIREQIHEDVRDSDHENTTLQQWVVAGGNGLYREAGDAGPGENCFCDDSTSQQRAELQTENGNDGDERVSKRVAKQNGAQRKAFGTSGSNVIARKFFEHGAANHACENRSQRGTESCGRQDVVAGASAS